MATKKKKSKLMDSISEIKKELFERSVWPTRSEVFAQTIVVIILLSVASFALGAVDYAITFLTRILLQGDVIGAILGSKVTLFVILAAVILAVAYFGIRYLRKNRYSR